MTTDRHVEVLRRILRIHSESMLKEEGDAIEASIAALRAVSDDDIALRAVSGSVGGEDALLHGLSDAVKKCREAGHWKPCSGCHETIDGHQIPGTPYSSALGCYLGGGCDECGGIGAQWLQYGDYDTTAAPQVDGGKRLQAVIDRLGQVAYRADRRSVQDTEEAINREIGELQKLLDTAAQSEPPTGGLTHAATVVGFKRGGDHAPIIEWECDVPVSTGAKMYFAAPGAALQVDGRDDFLPNGTRVLWQSGSGAEFPGTITGYNPASYNCKLDDGCTADGYARGRFKRIAAVPPAPSFKLSNPPAPDSREARMVVVEQDVTGRPTVWCDPEIVDLVRALNAGGVRTVASCSGHGEKHGAIALRDGRELLILPDFETSRAFERHLLAFASAQPMLPADHPIENRYQHFLAYANLDHDPMLRYAYYHGADVGLDKPEPPADGEEDRPTFKPSGADPGRCWYCGKVRAHHLPGSRCRRVDLDNMAVLLGRKPLSAASLSREG